MQHQIGIMAEKKPTTKNEAALFGKHNYTWMIAGAVVIMIGFFLMAGGKSEDVNVFNEEQVYSKLRITVAPIILLIGFGLEVFAIFRKPRN